MKAIRTLIASLCMFFMPATIAMAASVTLRWDANDPTPEGYLVFAREAGQSYDYTHPAWQGSDVTCTISTLTQGTTYHFVVRAYEGALESADSEEVSYTPPISDVPPDTPSVLQIEGIGQVTAGLIRITVEQLQPDGTWRAISFATTEPAPEPDYPFKGNSTSHVYHKQGCRYFDSADVGFESIEDATAAGYRPCGICKPDGS